MDDAARAELNEKLAGISEQVFGEKLTLRVVGVNDVKVLDASENARYMKPETYSRLTANLSKDGVLESAPLVHPNGNGELVVTSGNHRVIAARDAGLKHILVLVGESGLNEGERLKKQLSHNALVGEDDPQILVGLWAKLDTLEQRLYSGLDSEQMAELEKIDFRAITGGKLRVEAVTLFFTHTEKLLFDSLLDRLRQEAVMSDVYLAPIEKFDAFWRAVVDAKADYKVKNTTTALMVLIDRIEEESGVGVNGDAPSNHSEG